MAPDEAQRVISAVGHLIGQTERRVLDELAVVKTQVARLEVQTQAQERMCILKHELVGKEIGGVRCEVERQNEQLAAVGDVVDITSKHDLSKLQEQLKAQEATKSYWVRYAVATFIGFILSGGGLGILEFARWKSLGK